MIEHIEETTSTNDDGKLPKYRHGDVIWAERQTKGRGQRGHTWSSVEGENLTFSLVLEPHFLPVARQFSLSQAVALSLIATFAGYGIDTRIKWTNDIYCGERKLVGILIENSMSTQTLGRTVVGIGINVNQREFDPALPNPVSMAQIAGHEFRREEVLERFLGQLFRHYEMLEQGHGEALHAAYCEKMFRKDEKQRFRLPSGECFDAVVEGVKPSGELLLRHPDGTLHAYLFREVEFVLK